MQKGKSVRTGQKFTNKCQYCGKPGRIIHSKYYANGVYQRKDCTKCSNLLMRYGIDSTTYDELLEKQGGTCAVCDVNLCSNSKGLRVDLDPYTGEPRGLLCDVHHEAVVGIGNNIHTLERIVDYLNLNTQP